MAEDNGLTNGQKRQRDEKGRFVPGWNGGPGRPPGPTTSDLKEAIRGATTKADIVAIFLKAVDQAKRGNSDARKFIFQTLGLIEILVDVTSAGEKVGPPDAAALAEALAILGAANGN